MIWIIASIPFWVVAATAAVVAAASIWCGLHGEMYRRGIAAGKLNQRQESYFLIGVGFWIVSGGFAIIAAKICS
jgi:hypothetical protein